MDVFDVLLSRSDFFFGLFGFVVGEFECLSLLLWVAFLESCGFFFLFFFCV